MSVRSRTAHPIVHHICARTARYVDKASATPCVPPATLREAEGQTCIRSSLAQAATGNYEGVRDERTMPVEEALRRRLSAMAPASRARLLRLVDLPTAKPAILIEALYADSEFLPFRDFLLELEEGLPTLAAVVAELRRMERNDHLHSVGSGTMGHVHARP